MLSFRHPTTLMVAGPTGCGKTQFLVDVLENKMIRPLPQGIVWVYGEWQPAYDKIRSIAGMPKVEFIKGFDDGLYESINSTVRNLVVLDDQMENEEVHKGSGSRLAKFFTQGSHHRNLTVIYVVQNLYHHSSSMRTVSLNSHYLVLFANPRDKTQVRTLAYQMYPQNPRFLVDAFEDATSRPYGYLLLDLRPDTPSSVRVRTDIFNSSQLTVYQPSNEQAGGEIIMPI